MKFFGAGLSRDFEVHIRIFRNFVKMSHFNFACLSETIYFLGNVIQKVLEIN